MKQRVDYIDIAKALAIFCVLLGHTVSSDTETKQFMYAFHMPLFFALSGIFMKDGNMSGFKDFVCKKAWTLMLPYFIWGLIYAHFSFKNLAFIVWGTRETLSYAQSLTSLWFLPVMFVGYLLNYIASILSLRCRYKSIVDIIILLCFLLVGFTLPHPHKFGLPWAIDVSFIAAAFMKIGQMSKQCVERVSIMNTKCLLPLLVAGVAIFCFSFQYSTSSVGYILMASACYGNQLYFIGNALLGGAIVLILAVLLDRVPFRKQELLFVGQNTLGIFLVHKPFVQFGRKVTSHFFLDYNCLPMAILIVLLSLIIVSGIVWLINRYLPVFFGLNNKIICKI